MNAKAAQDNGKRTACLLDISPASELAKCLVLFVLIIWQASWLATRLAIYLISQLAAQTFDFLQVELRHMRAGCGKRHSNST